MSLIDTIKERMAENKRLKIIEEKEYRRLMKKKKEYDALRRARERLKRGSLLKQVFDQF